MTDNNSPMTVGRWLITMIVLMIPVVNLVMLLVWAFGNGNECRSNYSKAVLIFILILIGVTILLSVLGVSMVPPPGTL